MSKVQKKKISQFGKTITGKTPSSTCPEDFGSKYMFITPSDSFSNKFIDKSERYLSEIGKDKLSSKLLPPKSILITCIGSAMGKVSLNRFNCITNQQINSIDVNDDYDPDYLYYIFKHNYELLRNASTGSTAVPILNKTDFDGLELLVHENIEDQQKIASILSTLDAKIELNNKINAELEAMAKTLYDYWFVQFDFPDENGKPYKSSGGEMIWSNELKRDLPKGWEVKKLKDIFAFEKGIEPGSSEYLDSSISENCIKFFRVGDIEGESSVYVDSSNKKYVIVEERDVIVTFDGSVGKLGFGLKGAFSGGLRKIYDKSKKIDNSLVYFIFKDERIIATIHKYATGSILLHASSAIDHLTIPFKENIYLQFQKIVKPIFDQMVKNKQENQKLAELRDFLLPMLMNGQIVVE